MGNIVTYQEKENIATITIDYGKANAVLPDHFHNFYFFLHI